MAVDESFKKSGAVPFKWEIEPGVPKHHQDYDHHRLAAVLPLKPPPSPRGSNFSQQPVPQVRFSPSSSRTKSDHRRVKLSTLARTEVVSSGCFPSRHLLRKNSSKLSIHRPDYSSDLETHSRRSASSRKSILPPYRPPLSSSAYVTSPAQSLPRPMSDTEWAGFGLF